MEENELIAALKSGDSTAFKKLVESYKNRIYNTILGIIQHQEDAEDLSQEVFIEIYKSVQHFREDAQLFTWIYRIAISKSLEFLRKKKRKKRFAFLESFWKNEKQGKAFDVPDFIHPGITLENKEQGAILFKRINELPENQKIAFTLNKLEDLSYQEIAKIMGLSVSAVESLLSRAKKNLQKKLEGYFSILQGK